MPGRSHEGASGPGYNGRHMTLLQQMRALKHAYGGDAAGRKLDLLNALDRHALRSSGAVLRLHEWLCFLRAYPDNQDVLDVAGTMLARFDRRADVRRHRKALADTGIAGTAIHYVFFWFTAQWIARRWPARITIDWKAFDDGAEVERLLPLLLPYSETPTIDAVDLPLRELLQRLKGPAETDAAFLVRRFETIHPTTFGRETIYERLGIPLVLAPGPGTPSRTLAKHESGPPVFQTRPLDRSRPVLRGEIAKPPQAVRSVPPEEADRLIDLARSGSTTSSGSGQSTRRPGDSSERNGAGWPFIRANARARRRFTGCRPSTSSCTPPGLAATCSAWCRLGTSACTSRACWPRGAGPTASGPCASARARLRGSSACGGSKAGPAASAWRGIAGAPSCSRSETQADGRPPIGRRSSA